MAARKPTGYKVIAAAAVVRKGKSERYLYRGDEIQADALDAENAKHLLGIKLIEPIFGADEESTAAKAKAEADAKAAAEATRKAADDAAKNQTPPAS